MSILDQLTGPFIRCAGALVSSVKRGTLNFSTGLTAVDNPTQGWTDVTATAVSILSKVVTDWGVAINTGWSLFYNTTGDGTWEAQRGLRVIATGEVQMIAATPVNISCADLAAGDMLVMTLKTVGGTPSTPNILTRTDGDKFTAASTASNTSTYYWMILRPAAAEPA